MKSMSGTISIVGRRISMSGEVLHKKRCDILKVGFNLVDYAAAIQTIDRWREKNGRHYVTLVNPHSVIQCGRDEEMQRAIKQADMTLPDGIGIILAARLLRYAHKGRVTGPTLMLKVCDWGRKYGYRHYFFGGDETIAQRLPENIAKRYPGLEIAGSCACPVSSQETPDDAKVVDTINSSEPDIVWVGLGSPNQEKWMARNQGKIKAPLMIGVGAAFAYHSGVVRWAPAWIRKLGLEWAYRLIRYPKRMWPRNVDNTIFLAKVVKQLVGEFFKSGNSRTGKMGRSPSGRQDTPSATDPPRCSEENRELI